MKSLPRRTWFGEPWFGSLISGNGVSLTYASFNKPETIARGSALISFAHDTEHQRFKQISSAGETLYLADAGVMAERLAGSGGVTQWTNYLFAGSKMIGMRVERSDATTYTRYFHKDHLGSIATITDEAGAVVERLSYDAWGKRRFPNGQDDPTGSISSQTTRGFTGQEELADVGLVHMNGRVYDPLLGRFGTPDPTTESPFSTQGWNRYTYVGNSPLNFTDPSGYCFAGCFWQKPFKWLGGVFRRIPIIGQLVTITAGFICGPVCSTIASAAVTGLASGKLGLALKAGFISAATAFAFDAVGTATLGPDHATPEFLSDKHIANIAGHALVGCASSVASGDKCGPGALSAAVGATATPLVNKVFPNPRTDLGDRTGGTIATAVVGGFASVGGGGKFANGAVTAAFGYLYNNTQYMVSLGATLAAFIGGGRSVGAGISIPDDWTDFGNYQLIGGVQEQKMFGFGIYASYGLIFSYSSSDGLLPSGGSWDSGLYSEGDVGIGGIAVGASTQQSWDFKSGGTFSFPAAPHIGQGLGFYAGVGTYDSRTWVSKPIKEWF